MPYYTEKQIDQARSIDLLTYLQSFEPTELVHVRGTPTAPESMTA